MKPSPPRTSPPNGGELRVTISIGYAICPPGEERELKDLLAEADTALYSAKRAGRNRVVSFDAGMARPGEGDRDPALRACETHDGTLANSGALLTGGSSAS